MTKNQTTNSEKDPARFDQVGQIAYVDFYFEGFDIEAEQVILKVGREYTIKAIIGNICDNRVFNWSIWGASPTSPSTQEARVKYSQVGMYTVELILRTSHVGHGSACSSNGQKRKVNYVKVVK